MNEDRFCFAGLLGKAVTKEGDVQAFSLLTTAPGPDTKPYHDREPVILNCEHWGAWLAGADPCRLDSTILSVMAGLDPRLSIARACASDRLSSA